MKIQNEPFFYNARHPPSPRSVGLRWTGGVRLPDGATLTSGGCLTLSPPVDARHCRAYLKETFVILFVLLTISIPFLVRAQETNTDDLNRQIKERQERVGELDGMIGNYRAKIEEAQQANVSLENQLALLENRIKEKELAIQRANLEIESLELELRVIQSEIGAQEIRI